MHFAGSNKFIQENKLTVKISMENKFEQKSLVDASLGLACVEIKKADSDERNRGGSLDFEVSFHSQKACQSLSCRMIWIHIRLFILEMILDHLVTQISV